MAGESQLERWLKSVPASDTSRSPDAERHPTWSSWADAGRKIAGAQGELASMLLHASDPFQRATAAMALGFIAADDAWASLIEALDDVPHVAMEAALSLGRIGSDSAVEPLCRVLQHPDVNV